MIIQRTTEYSIDVDEVVENYPNFYRSYTLSNREDPEGFVRMLLEDHFTGEDTKDFLEYFGTEDYTEVHYVG